MENEVDKIMSHRCDDGNVGMLWCFPFDRCWYAMVLSVVI